eukprot:TRINITY_DN19771_c0_g1_i3.p1 TRINITY_DN19771_c0_g1~~TRINITY_DN19771_c0_g1_i3.p1  ORF type:complete len:395 (+),score=80.26 TRINITY_DN19771_c0_g1_i3:659-1843(+)
MERDVEDALSRAVANEVINQHRLPTQREMEDTVEDEIHSIWDSLQAARRYEFNQTRYELSDRHGSFTAFFSSARWLSWMLLAATTACSVLVYRLVALDLPTSTEYHAAALFGWFTLAGLYALAMHALREDPAAMTMWTVGYLLELMFSLENVFVFHVIVKVFELPSRLVKYVLFLLVLFQIKIQMVFYMGLASWLRSLQVLPYILGVWLIYIGYLATLEDDPADPSSPQQRCLRVLSWSVGEATPGPPSSEEQKDSLVAHKNGKLSLQPAGLLLLCLLVVDFMLEVDVTVTKIELHANEYICFSSSVVASFAMPELFFLARDLFERLPGLKYGIAFVLVFFGLQALLHNFIQLHALTSLAVVLLAMALSIVVCAALQRCGARASQPDADVAAGT